MIFILFCLIFGGIFLYVGISARNSQRRVRAFGVRTKALIIDFHVEVGTSQSNSQSNFSDTVYYHYPIVRFTDEDGVETIQKLNYTENQSKLNQQIDIMYIKHDDENFYEIIIDSNPWKNVYPQLFMAIGIVALSIGGLRLLGYLVSN